VERLVIMQVEELIMRSDADEAKKAKSNSKFRIYGIIALLCVLSYLILGTVLRRLVVPGPPKLPPPDLSRCTRVEIRYYPSTLECFFITPEYLSLLSLEETQYLRSL